MSGLSLLLASMNTNFKKRMRAGLVHLALSLLVAVLVILIIFRVWYPGALAELQGVSHILLIMLAVDVCLGPLLTVIAFNPRKSLRELRVDLGLIGAVQIAALVFGVSTIAQGRPTYLVFNIDRFSLVSPVDLDSRGLEIATHRAGVGGLSWLGPRTVSARLPADPKAREEILFSALNGGGDLAQRPEWYLPYEDERETALKKLRPIAELKKANGLTEPQWRALLDGLGEDPARIGYLPLMAYNKREGVVFIDRRTAEIVSTAALLPVW
ncbi:TfpX/TfpZ family type IV pilin accessory protein [Solimonas sp. SE-A11]|uniref:TfpX/TfpZ family type IV pilin accessory protein n=1 Tax=Solimonas sp. SE-A11 TaxID=3054954 RepID=UPI00259D20B5|nr:TfpX/TfpZ family type IV pilin accessory protein [Solimonas sp. SE-A11]